MVTLHTIDGGTVNAINDALLYDFIIGQNGIATGATVTSEGALLLHIDSGWGVIKGRIFSIEAETISATPSTSGTVKGRLILQIDITNTTNPIAFVTQAAATLPALQQEDINNAGTIFQLPIATYDVNEVALSNLQMVAPVVEAVKQQIDSVRSAASAAQNTANNAMPKSGGTFTGGINATITGNLISPYEREKSANTIPFVSKQLIHFLATSSMTEGKPPTDAVVLHMNWDKSPEHPFAVQLAVSVDSSDIYFRRNNADIGEWESWETAMKKSQFYVSGSTLNISI